MSPDEVRLYGVKERLARYLLGRPGVTAVGIGGRERAGRPTGEQVIKVFVEHKRPVAQLRRDERLPGEVDGIGVDVSELSLPYRLDGPLAEGGLEPPGALLTAAADTGKHRPLVGGFRLQAEVAGAPYGTLGCIVVHQSDPAKVYALTNHHVLSNDGKSTLVPHVTKAGSPTNFDSSTKCCSEIIGRFAAGSDDVSRDAALIELDPGLQWRAEIADIGFVTGVHPISADEARTQRYPVRKRGQRTRLTGGVVLSINTTLTFEGVTRHNYIVIRPNPNNAAPPDADTYFAEGGDSGSVVVNAAREVVGLIVLGTREPNTHRFVGIALPIVETLASFAATDGVAVSMATATELGVVHTVPGAGAVRVPEELAPVLVGPAAPERVLVPAGTQALPSTRATAEVLAALRSQLSASPTGRLLAGLWSQHQPELVRLVTDHRRVGMVWQRCGGPALLQTLIRMVDDPGIALPRTINGTPLATCLARIHDAFAAAATPELRAALRAVRAVLPDLGGLTYPQIVAALDAG